MSIHLHSVIPILVLVLEVRACNLPPSFSVYLSFFLSFCSSRKLNYNLFNFLLLARIFLRYFFLLEIILG